MDAGLGGSDIHTSSVAFVHSVLILNSLTRVLNHNWERKTLVPRIFLYYCMLFSFVVMSVFLCAVIVDEFDLWIIGCYINTLFIPIQISYFMNSCNRFTFAFSLTYKIRHISFFLLVPPSYCKFVYLAYVDVFRRSKKWDYYYTNSTVTSSYFSCLWIFLVRLIYLFMQSLVVRVRSFNFNLSVCVISLCTRTDSFVWCFYFELLK